MDWRSRKLDTLNWTNDTVEPVSGEIPANLIVINTVTQVANGQMNTRIVSISDEDVWLQSHTRIGVLHEIQDVVDTNNAVNEEIEFVLEITTDQPQQEPFTCPIDLSDVDCTPEPNVKLDTCKCLYKGWGWPWTYRDGQEAKDHIRKLLESFEKATTLMPHQLCS